VHGDNGEDGERDGAGELGGADGHGMLHGPVDSAMLQRFLRRWDAVDKADQRDRVDV
jgi:hypothetical protein